MDEATRGKTGQHSRSRADVIGQVASGSWAALAIAECTAMRTLSRTASDRRDGEIIGCSRLHARNLTRLIQDSREASSAKRADDNLRVHGNVGASASIVMGREKHQQQIEQVVWCLLSATEKSANLEYRDSSRAIGGRRSDSVCSRCTWETRFCVCDCSRTLATQP